MQAHNDPGGWQQAECTSSVHPVQKAWCEYGGDYPLGPNKYSCPATFEPPAHVAHPCFLRNGSWAGATVVPDRSGYGTPHACMPHDVNGRTILGSLCDAMP